MGFFAVSCCVPLWPNTQTPSTRPAPPLADWNGGKPVWSSTKPMSAEEFMLDNVAAIKRINPSVIGWVCECMGGGSVG